MSNEKALPCLSGKGLTKIFGNNKTKNLAVDHVDFEFLRERLSQL